MRKATGPLVKCYIAQEKSSHQGSGGGFVIVKFYHLVVENKTAIPLRKVKATYRLMKGNDCFQEDALFVEQIGPWQTVKSAMFIRDSPFFDRTEWVGAISVEADQEISQECITFDKTIPGSSYKIFTIVAIIILASALSYLLFFHK